MRSGWLAGIGGRILEVNRVSPAAPAINNPLLDAGRIAIINPFRISRLYVSGRFALIDQSRNAVFHVFRPRPRRSRGRDNIRHCGFSADLFNQPIFSVRNRPGEPISHSFQAVANLTASPTKRGQRKLFKANAEQRGRDSA